MYVTMHLNVWIHVKTGTILFRIHNNVLLWTALILSRSKIETQRLAMVMKSNDFAKL